MSLRFRICATAAVLLGCALGALPTARAQTGDGSLDTRFANRATFQDYAIFSHVARQADGKVIVAGDFTQVDALPLNGLARLNADGTLDRSYNPGIDQRSGVRAMALQPDGKLLAGGLFTSVHGVRRYGVARFNTDGSLDTSFDPGATETYYVNDLALQADGKIVIGGIQDITPTPTYRLLVTRLNANGSVDATFKADESQSGAGVSALAVQPDGKVLVSGQFSGFNGQARPGSVARLNANGSVDTTFSLTGKGADYQVYTFAVQPDGKIVVGGDFTQLDGTAQARVARLNADGTLDASFHGGADATVNKAVLQSDGKVLIGGFFLYVGSGGDVSQASIARLNADGSPDASFFNEIAVGPGGAPVNDFVMVPDEERLLIAGGFDSIDTDANAYSTPGVAKLRVGVPSTPFFDGTLGLDNGVFYLAFSSGNPFGYYSYLDDPRYLYHFDLGYEYWFDAADGKGGVYLYDFASSTFFYTSPTFPFPYLYDFSLNTTLYYYPDPNNPGRYNTNGVRYFYNYATGKIITK